MACRSASIRDFSCLSVGTMKQEHQMMAAVKTATANATQNAVTNREAELVASRTGEGREKQLGNW